MKPAKQLYIDVTAKPHAERQIIFIKNMQTHGFEKFLKINDINAEKERTFYVFCYRKNEE